MRRGAAIYKNSAGSAEIHKLSARAPWLHKFVSDSWAVSRIIKFVPMAVFFKYDAAAVVVAIYSILLAVLGFPGKLPTVINSCRSTKCNRR